MSLSIAIMAHGKALETFKRHLPFWKAHDPDKGIVICPEEDPIPDYESPWPVLYMLNSEHNGDATIIRHRCLLSTLAATKTAYHIVFEYDSISLSPQSLVLQAGFTGIVKANCDPADFIAPRYATPPWLMDHNSAISMSEIAIQWPAVYEQGYNDRWMAAIAHLAGVPIIGFNPPGFTANTVSHRHIADMQQAIQKGCTMLHGIKDAWVLDTALHFRKQRQP